MVRLTAPSRTVGIVVVAALIASVLLCTNPAGDDDDNPSSSYQVYLVGKVLTSAGNPVPHAIARLKEFDVCDTTDSKGEYQLIVDAEDGLARLSGSAADTSDSLSIVKDGQIITMLGILDFIDTLPDIFVVQRNIAGEIESTMTDFGRIQALVWNEDDGAPVVAELYFSQPTMSYSGFVYFVYTGALLQYGIYVNVYDSDGHFTGRSDTIHFSSVAGDIQIPPLNPLNALPVLQTPEDTVVGINDTIALLDLRQMPMAARLSIRHGILVRLVPGLRSNPAARSLRWHHRFQRLPSGASSAPWMTTATSCPGR